MSGMTPDEAIATYERNRLAYQAAGLDLSDLHHTLEQTRLDGFSLTVDVITKDISAIGMLIPLGSAPVAALSIGRISSRMNPDRRRELGRLLADCLTEFSS